MITGTFVVQLYCDYCNDASQIAPTAHATFRGPSPNAAMIAAKAAGWVQVVGSERHMCPACVEANVPRARR